MPPTLTTFNRSTAPATSDPDAFLDAGETDIVFGLIGSGMDTAGDDPGRFSVPGSTGITVVSAVELVSGQLVEVTLTGAIDLEDGEFPVRWTNDDESFFDLEGRLTTNAASAPISVDSITPNTATQGTVDRVYRIKGNFQEGAVASLDPATGAFVAYTKFIDSETLDANISFGQTSLVQAYDLIVTNPDEGTDTLEGAITVGAGDIVTRNTLAKRFQMPLAVDDEIENGMVMSSTLWGKVNSGATALTDSVRGNGHKALKLGPFPTEGDSEASWYLQLPAAANRIVMDMETLLTTATGTPSEHSGFLDFFKISGLSVNTIRIRCRINASNGEFSTVKSGIASSSADEWSLPGGLTAADLKGTPFRWRIEATRATSGQNGTVRTWLWHDGEFHLVNEATHAQTELGRVHLHTRLLAADSGDWLTNGAIVEHRKVCLNYDVEFADALVWSDRQNALQLRAIQHEAGGTFEQRFAVRYEVGLYGLPSDGRVEAHVQVDTDPDFGDPQEASLIIDEVAQPAGITDTDYMGFVDVEGIAADSTLHYRVRFTDPDDEDSVLLDWTDSGQFRTPSHAEGEAGTIVFVAGTCSRGHTTQRPHNWADQVAALRPHFIFWSEPYYAEGALNAQTTSPVDATEGDARKLAYMKRVHAELWLQPEDSRMLASGPSAAMTTNHIVNAPFPDFNTPTASAEVLDAWPAFNRYWYGGQFVSGDVTQSDTLKGCDYSIIRTRHCVFFVCDPFGWHNNEGAHGAEGRDFSNSADPRRLLGATQFAALIDTIEGLTAEDGIKYFVLVSDTPLAGDLQNDDSVNNTSWARTDGTGSGDTPGSSPGQRALLLAAFLDNEHAGKKLIALSGDWHWSAVTRRGIDADDRIGPNFICAPVAQTVRDNFFRGLRVGGVLTAETAFATTNGRVPGATSAANEWASMYGLFVLDERTGVLNAQLIDGERGTAIGSHTVRTDGGAPFPFGEGFTPHPRGSGLPRDPGFTVDGSRPQVRGTGLVRPYTPRP